MKTQTFSRHKPGCQAQTKAPPVTCNCGAGHGHAFPNANKVVSRCGGPALCSSCRTDQAELEAGPEDGSTPSERALDGADEPADDDVK